MAQEKSSGSFDFALQVTAALRLNRGAPLKITVGEALYKDHGAIS